jgi:MoaA/NifB/PqqE/SkfB family radical SAM enzyme
LSEYDTENFHADALLTEIRRNLGDGVKHPACKLCWDAESKGITSWRQAEGKLPSNLIGANFDTQPYDRAVSRIEIKLDSTCDLACIYCGPWNSSSWHRENKKTKFLDFEAPEPADTGLHQKVIDTITEIGKYVNVLEIGFTGNEALISKHFKNGKFKKFLDAFYVHAPRDATLILKFVTNCNTPSKIFDKNMQVLQQCREHYIGLKVHVAMSLESVGEFTESTRYLSDWKLVDKNINKWLACKWITTSFNTAFNSITITNIVEFIRYLTLVHETHNRQINISPNVVYYPEGLNPSVLPDIFKEHVIDALEILGTIEHMFVDDEDCGYERFKQTLENMRDTIGTDTPSLYKLKKYLDYSMITRKIRIDQLNPILYNAVYIDPKQDGHNER